MPIGEKWLHEIKWDGYRMLVDLVEGKVDADAERAGILPAHQIVDQVLAARA